MCLFRTDFSNFCVNSSGYSLKFLNPDESGNVLHQYKKNHHFDLRRQNLNTL